MNIMGQTSHICRARVSLICFATVECHAANRVMRLSGLQRTIPQDPPNFDKLHKIDLRDKIEYNWPQKHEFNFAIERMEKIATPQSHNNLIQIVDYVHLACKELVKALAELNPTSFSISQPRAPPTQHFAMSVYDSELQHQSSSQTYFQLQPQMSSPHLYGEQPYGAFTTFSTNYHMSQSSQYKR
ncbi:hypothetical protein Lal_00012287 [Lupinus albus]|nr:hypothetical protein Lal_00012287 [Lupinus albus]